MAMTTVMASRSLPALDPAGVAAALATSPERWLPAEAHRLGSEWTAVVGLGRLHVPVALAVGASSTHDGRLHRPLRWTPVPRGPAPGLRAAALPDFDGQLLATADEDGVATLLLTGRYQPPGQALGSVIDRLLLHKVAEQSVEELQDGIAVRIATLARPPTTAGRL